jgi:predicted PurR-regulated permease PerM
VDFQSLPIPRDVRWRRLIAVVLFLGMLYVFRKLAPVLICFVLFERTLGGASDFLFERTRLNRKASIAGILTLFSGAIGVGLYFGVRSLIHFIQMVRSDGPGYVESVTKSSIFITLKERLDLDASDLTKNAKEYANQVFNYLTETAYVGLFLFVGFILAIIYLFEREDIDEWAAGIEYESVLGTMSRWLGFVADAIAITVRLQIVVALFNAILTLPLVLALGLPNPGLLFLLVLVCGLVPVVGGLVSGVVLCIVSYDAKGLLGVGIFLGVTFLLSKVESYYLTPRLTAQHVKLPGLVLVISLLMFETLFGIYGLFLSFPSLYVAAKIANEWKNEKAEIVRSMSVPPTMRSTVPPPVATTSAPPAPIASVPPKPDLPPTDLPG